MRELTRREFFVTSSVVLGAAGWVFGQAPAEAPPVVPQFEALRNNVGVFTARGGTIGWLIGPDGIVIVDSQFADTAVTALAGVKERGAQPCAGSDQNRRGCREDGSQPGLSRHDVAVTSRPLSNCRPSIGMPRRCSCQPSDVDSRSIADDDDDPRTRVDDGWGELKTPILQFASTGMGGDFVLNGIYTADRSGSPDVTLNVLERYGHLDVLVGEQAVRDVFPADHRLDQGPRRRHPGAEWSLSGLINTRRQTFAPRAPGVPAHSELRPRNPRS